ncbi:MAG TPA: deaminase [Saccharofermentans sp.]|nr:deaminase [Saccharofermentans sp.]
MFDKYDDLYMDLAIRAAEMSYSNRKKVGGLLVKDKNVISTGWNGTPTGWDNKCEDEFGNTLPIVIHTEQNLIAKCARAGISTAGATMYITLSPCYDCAKIIIQSMIIRVIYKELYRISDAVDFLKQAGIEVVQYSKEIRQ